MMVVAIEKTTPSSGALRVFAVAYVWISYEQKKEAGYHGDSTQKMPGVLNQLPN